MGDWRMEVMRMSIYMAFPVALFYYFNQPQLFEEWVIKTKKTYYPPDDPKMQEKYQALVRDKQRHRNQELLAALEASGSSGDNSAS